LILFVILLTTIERNLLMGQFLKFILATIIGLFIFSFLVVMIFIAVISSASSGTDHAISDNSILKIKINKNIEERESDDFLGSLSPFDANEGGTIGLLNLRLAIKHAKTDNKIKGIFLELHNTHTGFATLEELRNEMIDFKKSGKYIVAYSESYSEGSYYLASVADKIFLPNSGQVEINGLDMELLYFKGTLEKLQIKPEVFKVGTYKSAVEPFILDKMSDANRTQLRSFLNSIYDNYLRNVAVSRGINENELKEISQFMLVRNADDALKYKIVTDLGYYDNAEEYLRTKLGLGKKDKIKFISYPKYEASIDHKSDEEENKDIAVIFASGAIEQGMGNAQTIGSEKIASEIRKARLNDKVKAIVLRINSPGGSALASDIIWREVMLARKDKPIIASMSDLAASGGYYIAMACDTIVANRSTITGSIGVFGLLFNGQDFLKDKLGITSDREKTGKYSDIITFTRELTDDEKAIVQEEVERIYRDFTQKAAEGRRMNVDSLRKIAEGRVWSGMEGKQNGLVDMFGGLNEAIAIAAKKAGLAEKYTIGYFPEQKNLFLKQLVAEFSGDDEGTSALTFNSEFSKFYPYIKTIKDLEKMEGIQARLPYEIILK
jgi:protease IV